jgi:hypothetical protein
MNIRKIALSSVAAIGLVAALGVTSVSAHSRHPATADENAQTDQLNQQALSAAQGSGTAGPATAPNVSTPNAMTPDQNAGTGGTSTMAPTAPVQNNTGTAMPDQPAAPGTAAPNAVTPNSTAPDTTPTPAPSPSTTAPDNTAAPTAANQDPAAPQPASGIAPKTPQ